MALFLCRKRSIYINEFSFEPSVQVSDALRQSLRDFFTDLLSEDVRQGRLSANDEGCEGYYYLDLKTLYLELYAEIPYKYYTNAEEPYTDWDANFILHDQRPYDWQSEHERFMYQSGLSEASDTATCRV